MCHLKKKKGFTLVELIIAISVLSVIVGMTTGLMIRMANTSAEQRRHQALREVEEQARMALLGMVRDTRMSYDANWGTPGVLVLNAIHEGEEIEITYFLDMGAYTGDGFTAPAGMSMNVLNREIVCVCHVAVADCPSWPNAFVPAVVNDVEFNVLPPGGRIGINIELIAPRFRDEPNPLSSNNNFRTLSINSAVSFERIPPP
ncbi:MAG: type II secretion system GspH family protein [Defluviitaleaceae bacterium]|nr:type II secretion system GspH family protein [Defluviitaleaceae bacterium]